MFEYAEAVFKTLDVPNVSLDIGFDGNNFYLFEFQAVYFGSFTVEKAPFYFKKDGNKWISVNSTSVLEDIYADSIVYYIRQRFLKE
jgi:hypothetical protein